MTVMILPLVATGHSRWRHPASSVAGRPGSRADGQVFNYYRYNDERMNAAKERLAYELTLMVHGKEAAEDSLAKAKAAFSGDSDNMPAATIPAGMRQVAEVLVAVAKVPSKSEAKRLIQGGGVMIDGVKVSDINAEISDSQRANGFVLQKGKKNFFKVTVE